ncbi:hypothetical protein PInf_006751 [Phytophthora infestans]|nr:hypothetical protein PInf_006751 [Phytophthora infestans]
MPPTATPSSNAAACEPDIEDLIKCEASDATKHKYAVLLTQHNAKRHDFWPQELLTTRTELLAWYDAHRRKLPWRGDPPPYLTTATHTSQKKKRNAASTKTGLAAFLKKEVEDVKQDKKEEDEIAMDGDTAMEPRKVAPYETWVSEIMLQQTRVDTVVEYFLRWIDKFPTVAALAEANEEDVNALWAGLGYYRRARMLHAGAKYVVENYDGELPSTVDQLLTIPGIGPYTAGAIASIAFGNREPLVDGNVIRVMARMRAVGADPKNKQLIKYSWKAAKELVEECDRPGALNQALMELGATISFSERRDLGELTHVFSHVKHHMGIEHVHFKSQPELSVESDVLRWMTVAEMKQRGITTGVKKILQLVLHPDKATGNSKAKTKAATSAVSHVTDGKRLKTIASFFKK